MKKKDRKLVIECRDKDEFTAVQIKLLENGWAWVDGSTKPAFMSLEWPAFLVAPSSQTLRRGEITEKRFAWTASLGHILSGKYEQITAQEFLAPGPVQLTFSW